MDWGTWYDPPECCNPIYFGHDNQGPPGPPGLSLTGPQGTPGQSSTGPTGAANIGPTGPAGIATTLNIYTIAAAQALTLTGAVGTNLPLTYTGTYYSFSHTVPSSQVVVVRANLAGGYTYAGQDVFEGLFYWYLSSVSSPTVMFAFPLRNFDNVPPNTSLIDVGTHVTLASFDVIYWS